MDESARILQLLDPRKGKVCVKCSLAKDDGELLCSRCSSGCPDGDCRGPHPRGGQTRKDVGDEMCMHCTGFCEGLDRRCQGNLDDCSDRRCQRKGYCLGYSQRIPRSGFFVYQLDNGYVGMTYDPSGRQAEHESRGKPPHMDIDAHWQGVRRSDKRDPGEHRIRWLSPHLDSRKKAFRCEWALKKYRDFGKPNFREIFDEITGVSSVPRLEFEPPQLRWDGASEGFLFWLKWKFFGCLSSHKVVAVDSYELQRLDMSSGSPVVIGSKVLQGSDEVGELSLACSLSSIPQDAWRVRAVNDVGIPGPWSRSRSTHFGGPSRAFSGCE